MVSNPENSPPALPDLETVSLQRDGHVLLIGLNRPHKRNAFDRAMLADLSRAYGLLESDPSVRAGVLFAHGDHFTAGLDLLDVGPGIAGGPASSGASPPSVTAQSRSVSNVTAQSRSSVRRRRCSPSASARSSAV